MLYDESLIGSDIEFLPGIEEFNEYPESGMRATITDLKCYPDMDGLFEISFSYTKFKVHNSQYESLRFKDQKTLKYMKFSDLMEIEEEESYCMSEDFDFFKLLEERQSLSDVLTSALLSDMLPV